MSESTNNGNGSRVGLWASIILACLSIATVLASVVYVGFQTQANTAKLQEFSNVFTRLTQLEVALNEIETQFCAQDIVRNLMHANDQRQVSILWEKSFGTKWPTDNSYYPTICNRRVKS